MSRSIISDVRMIAHLCPFLFSGVISCSVTGYIPPWYIRLKTELLSCGKKRL